MPGRWGLLAGMAGAGLLLVGGASGSSGSFPGTAGSIVFQSNRDGNYDLYTASANGSGVRKLLSRPQTDEFNANWSPSGRRIVFQTGPPDRSTYDIWLVNHDGKSAKVLVGGASNDRAPQFCDEDTVVFTRQVTATNAEVYSVGADGKGLKQLTDNPASDSFPTCNAKGTRIAFISTRDAGAPRIYEMTRTGGGPRPLTDPGAADPDYSADGTSIAYVAFDADRNLEVFTKNLATGAVAQRTNVKPPFEYRLPKFVPLAAAKRAVARATENEPIVATHRNTQTSVENVHRVQEVTTPVAEPGSGGSVQPLGPCTCESLTVQVANATWQVGVRSGEERSIVRIDFRWAMTCTPGTGNCKARFTPLSPVAFGHGFSLGKLGEADVKCVGACGRTTTDTDRIQGTGRPEQLVFDFHVSTNCRFEKRQPKFQLVFTKTGRLDREKSHLG